MIKSIKIDEKLEKYISDHSYDLHPVQKEILSHNESLGDVKKMQISITQAYFFQLFIKMNNIKSILEVGTFTGYSTLSMALSLNKNGKILTIDKDKQKNMIAKRFFRKAKILNKIILDVSNGNDALIKLIKNKKKYDLILIDADKENYISYFDKSLKLLNKNGLLVVDNILWKGDVININSKDKLTKKIKLFNLHVKKSKINKYILPIGDGFYICWK